MEHQGPVIYHSYWGFSFLPVLQLLQPGYLDTVLPKLKILCIQHRQRTTSLDLGLMLLAANTDAEEAG